MSQKVKGWETRETFRGQVVERGTNTNPIEL